MNEELQKYYDLLETEFILATKPNPAAISSILSAAKGNHRTMKQFSKETGLTESTLSRIATEKIKESLSPKIIGLISLYSAENSYDTFCALAQANGYLRFNDQKIIQDRQSFINHFDSFSAKYTMSVLVKAALFDRGCSIADFDDSYQTTQLGPIRMPDYDMKFQIAYKTHKYNWGFFLVPTITDTLSEKLTPQKIANEIFSDLSSLILCGVMSPDTLNNTKTSIVVQDADLYHAICTMFTAAKLNNWLSVCYIDSNKQNTIVETTFIQNDTVHNSSLFSLPLITRINFESGIGNRSSVDNSIMFSAGYSSVIDKKALGKKIAQSLQNKDASDDENCNYIHQIYHISQKTYNRLANGDDSLPDSLYIEISRIEGISWKNYNLERLFLVKYIFPALTVLYALMFYYWWRFQTGIMRFDLYNAISLSLISVALWLLNMTASNRFLLIFTIICCIIAISAFSMLK